jgi:hypothetical protein
VLESFDLVLEVVQSSVLLPDRLALFLVRLLELGVLLVKNLLALSEPLALIFETCAVGLELGELCVDLHFFLGQLAVVDRHAVRTIAAETASAD